jgi:hypothetical protein
MSLSTNFVSQNSSKALTAHPDTSQYSTATASILISADVSQSYKIESDILVDWVFTLFTDGLRLEAMNLRNTGGNQNGFVYMMDFQRDQVDCCGRGVIDAADLIRRLKAIQERVQRGKHPEFNVRSRDAILYGIQGMLCNGGENVWAAISKNGMPDYGLQYPVLLTMRIWQGCHSNEGTKFWYYEWIRDGESPTPFKE